MGRKRISNPVSVLDVAAHILANHCGKNPILAWKMHRLAYFCQTQQLINEGVPMFYEKILATHKGIMIKELCALHRNEWYIGDSSKGNLNHLSAKQIDVIAAIIEQYGDKTTEELDALVQQTSPWKKAMQAAGNKKEISIEIVLDT
jgi:uncharacterized phage-associated protein